MNILHASNKPHGLVIAPNLSIWDVMFEMHYTVTH